MTRSIMKTLLVTLIFFIQLPIVFGQDSTTNTFKNQLGVDATFFIKTYFQFNEFTGNPIPNYMLTYKRNFEKSSFRSAFGVNFESFFPNSAFDGDNNNYHNKSFDFVASAGWEWRSMISKRWLFYYGVDARYLIEKSDADVNYYSGGYANGNISQLQEVGIAPFLGIGFNINDRISLTTETSFAFIMSQSEQTTTYIPVSSDYPEKPNIIDPKVTSQYTLFLPPMFLLINFNL